MSKSVAMMSNPARQETVNSEFLKRVAKISQMDQRNFERTAVYKILKKHKEQQRYKEEEN